MPSILPPSASLDEFSRFAGIVRRHVHDVRNYLNSLDLEAALLAEVVPDPEVIEGVQRIRRQLSQLEAAVRGLSAKFADPQPVLLTAADLLQLWKSQVAALGESWQPFENAEPPDARQLRVDHVAVMSVLRELSMGALKRSPRRDQKAAVRTTSGEVVAELREPAEATPVDDGALEEFNRLVKASGGKFQRTRLSNTGEWVTSISFPFAEE